MQSFSRFALTCCLGLTISATGWASLLLGTQVTGDMNLGGTNYFDPANGFVPAGYGNSDPGGITVTIGDPLIEFGYEDGANTNTVDFTDTGFTLQDVSLSNSIAFPYTFTDNAFNGLILAEISDNFPGGIGFSLVGNTITLNFAGLSNPGTYTATYSLTATPEPQSMVMVGAALLLVGLVIRKRRVSASAAA